jgi:hypothetical protein
VKLAILLLKVYSPPAEVCLQSNSEGLSLEKACHEVWQNSIESIAEKQMQQYGAP